MSAFVRYIKRTLHQSPIIFASTVFSVAGTAAAGVAYYQGYERGPDAVLHHNGGDYTKYFMRELTYEISELLKSEGVNLPAPKQAVYAKLGAVKKIYDALNAIAPEDIEQQTEEVKKLKADFQKAVLAVAYDTISAQREEDISQYLPKKQSLFKRLGLSGEEIPIVPLALPTPPKVEDVPVPTNSASREEVVAYFNNIATVIMKA